MRGLLNLLLCLWCSSGLIAANNPQQGAKGKEIRLTVGRSVILDHPGEIKRVAITDDAVADVVAISTRELLINGKGAGITSLIVWSRSGERDFFTVSVGVNIEQLQEHIRATFPNENIQVSAIPGVITLSGAVSSRAVAERVVAMAAGFKAQ